MILKFLNNLVCQVFILRMGKGCSGLLLDLQLTVKHSRIILALLSAMQMRVKVDTFLSTFTVPLWWHHVHNVLLYI